MKKTLSGLISVLFGTVLCFMTSGCSLFSSYEESAQLVIPLGPHLYSSRAAFSVRDYSWNLTFKVDGSSSPDFSFNPQLQFADRENALLVKNLPENTYTITLEGTIGDSLIAAGTSRNVIVKKGKTNPCTINLDFSAGTDKGIFVSYNLSSIGDYVRNQSLAASQDEAIEIKVYGTVDASKLNQALSLSATAPQQILDINLKNAELSYPENYSTPVHSSTNPFLITYPDRFAGYSYQAQDIYGQPETITNAIHYDKTMQVLSITANGVSTVCAYQNPYLITLDLGANTKIQNIRFSAFEDCINLEFVTLPENFDTAKIDANAFKNCKYTVQ